MFSLIIAFHSITRINNSQTRSWIVAIQNSVKLSEVRHTADTKEAREEQTRVIENKLFVAERNRMKELEKRLEGIRKHVGSFKSTLIRSQKHISYMKVHLISKFELMRSGNLICLQFVSFQERRAMMVRQNKAAIASQQVDDCDDCHVSA